jgi:acetolactate synthase-1/2/3 large subunit
VTAGLPIFTQTRNARAHDWLSLTGGRSARDPAGHRRGRGLPGPQGPGLTGDGAGMYTVQGLWTIARERLDVTVVVFANHAYRILGIEMGRTGGGEPGPAASRLLDLSDPRIDWVSVAERAGPAGRAGRDGRGVRRRHEPGDARAGAAVHRSGDAVGSAHPGASPGPS